jgi:hypothetical protein
MPVLKLCIENLSSMFVAARCKERSYSAASYDGDQVERERNRSQTLAQLEHGASLRAQLHLVHPAQLDQCFVLIALGSLPGLALQLGQIIFKASCRQLQYLL